MFHAIFLRLLQDLHVFRNQIFLTYQAYHKTLQTQPMNRLIVQIINIKQPMDCDTQLTSQLYKYFLWWPSLPSKLGQTDNFWFVIKVHL